MARAIDMPVMRLFHEWHPSFNWFSVCVWWHARMNRDPFIWLVWVSRTFYSMRSRQRAMERENWLTVTSLSVLPWPVRLFFKMIDRGKREGQLCGRSADSDMPVHLTWASAIKETSIFQSIEKSKNILVLSPLAGCTINTRHTSV